MKCCLHYMMQAVFCMMRSVVLVEYKVLLVCFKVLLVCCKVLLVCCKVLLVCCKVLFPRSAVLCARYEESFGRYFLYDRKCLRNIKGCCHDEKCHFSISEKTALLFRILYM